MKPDNDKLLALVASIALPKEAPPLEAIPRDDLILTALIIFYKRGLSAEAAIKTLMNLGVTSNEIRDGFRRLVAYYAEKN